MSVEYITPCCKNLVRLNERTNGVDRADCIRVNSQNKRIRLRKIQSSLICEPAPGSNSRIVFNITIHFCKRLKTRCQCILSLNHKEDLFDTQAPIVHGHLLRFRGISHHRRLLPGTLPKVRKVPPPRMVYEVQRLRILPPYTLSVWSDYSRRIRNIYFFRRRRRGFVLPGVRRRSQNQTVPKGAKFDAHEICLGCEDIRGSHITDTCRMWHEFNRKKGYECYRSLCKKNEVEGVMDSCNAFQNLARIGQSGTARGH